MTRSFIIGAAVVALAGPLAAPAGAVSAALDPKFSGDGKARVDFARTATVEAARDVLVTATGKVVTAGVVTTAEDSRFAVARLRSDGSRDRGFDDDGRVTTGFRWSASANRMVKQGDTLVVGGTAGGRFALARYHRDGRLDRSFGGDGKVVTDLGAGEDSVLDLQVAADGSITAAGFAGDRFAVVRYSRSGDLDQTFGVGGRVITTAGFEGTARAVRLQPDGKLLVVGDAANWDDGWAVARFATDGTPDTSFGGDGSVTTQMPEQEEGSRARALTLQPDGRIVVVGTIYVEGDYSSFGIARYLPDGSLDSSFDEDGRLRSPVGAYYGNLNGVTVQPDGRIVAAGSESLDDTMISLVRYLPDGSPDTTFSGDGEVRTGFGEQTDSAAFAVAFRDHRIVLAGQVWTYGRNKVGVAVTRYRAR